MSGPIGLHGGGEYLPGDEPFLDALLSAGATAARARRSATATDQPTEGDTVQVRIAILPTAASRGRPDRAAAVGVAAFERRAAAAGISARVDVARIVDAASAADEAFVAILAAADVIHLPGGDPDLIPAILPGTRALDALRAAWQRGGVVAGASAGAMALAEWTWTPRGGMRGLGLVRGFAVVPHYDEIRRSTWQHVLERLAPGGIGYLGLDERTGVLSTSAEEGAAGPWRVAGPGAAWWFAPGAVEPVVTRAGEALELPD